MKLLAAILVALSYASIVPGQSPVSTCEPPRISERIRDDFKGPIKVIRTFETWFVVSEKTGRLEKQPRKLERESKFDPPEDGVGMGVGVSLNFGGEITGEVEVINVCGDNGKLKEQRITAKDGSLYQRTTYAYDDAGNMTEEVHTQQVHPQHFRPMRYDVYVTTKTTYKYDARGNKIEEKRSSPNGALYSTHFYNYDARDLLIKETHIDKLGRIEEQSFYEYHADGRPLTEINFNNHCITRAGDFCKGNISSGDGFFSYATKTKYQYDSQGNWIKQTEWHMDGELKNPVWFYNKITEREITYYRKP